MRKTKLLLLVFPEVLDQVGLLRGMAHFGSSAQIITIATDKYKFMTYSHQLLSRQ